MKNFKNLSEFNNYLSTLIKEQDKYMYATMDVAAQFIEDDAKRKFGVQQEEWPSYPEGNLAQSTQDQRVRLGFEPDNPLYRSGDLMHSIYHVVFKYPGVTKRYKAQIGSDEDIMLWMEEGTVTVPARPVLGPALLQNISKVKAIIEEGVAAWLTGKLPITRKPDLG